MTAPSRLHVALARIRAAVNGTIEKTGENKTQRYSFVEASAVAAKFLEEAGDELTMLPVAVSVVDVRPSASEKQLVFTVHTRWRITHVVSGESIDVESIGQGADNADKGGPKALTNAMKYALLMLLQAVGDDPEADEDVDRRERGKPAAKNTAEVTPAMKRMVRGKAREAGLDDDGLKALAFNVTGKRSSQQWSTTDVDKILSRLENESFVEAFRDLKTPEENE